MCRTCSLPVLKTNSFCCLFHTGDTISLCRSALTLFPSLPFFLNFSHTYGSLLLRLSRLSYSSSSHLAFFPPASPGLSSLPLHHTHSHHASAPAILPHFQPFPNVTNNLNNFLESVVIGFLLSRYVFALLCWLWTQCEQSPQKLLKHLSHTAAHPQQSPGWLQPIWEGTKETFPRPFIKLDLKVLVKVFVLLIVFPIITVVIWKIIQTHPRTRSFFHWLRPRHV